MTRCPRPGCDGEVVGGNCRTFTCGDFKFDSGAHRFHDKDPDITRGAPTNVEVTEGRNGEGFYEAVVRSLAEGR